MREIQFSQVETDLDQISELVEGGETVAVMRGARRVAWIVPEPEHRVSNVASCLEEIRVFRRTMPRLLVAEILSARHEDHRY